MTKCKKWKLDVFSHGESEFSLKLLQVIKLLLSAGSVLWRSGWREDGDTGPSPPLRHKVTAATSRQVEGRDCKDTQRSILHQDVNVRVTRGAASSRAAVIGLLDGQIAGPKLPLTPRVGVGGGAGMRP